MNYKKLMMAILVMVIVLSLALIAFLVSYFGIITIPNNNSCTWEEYAAMTPKEQEEFENSFKNEKQFKKWLEKVNAGEIYVPWENGGKAPFEYTWEEFEALNEKQQAEFQKSFEGKGFEEWLLNAQENAVLPWENGGKTPSEYSWEEYESLTDLQKDAFFESFESIELFDKWLNKAKGNDSLSWTDEEKDPSEYTWEEFEVLNEEQQAEFQKSFKDPLDFEEWLIKAQENAILPWENGGKAPSEYSWKEFEALSDFLKDAFFESFGSIAEFDKWLKANEPK